MKKITTVVNSSLWKPKPGLVRIFPVYLIQKCLKAANIFKLLMKSQSIIEKSGEFLKEIVSENE